VSRLRPGAEVLAVHPTVRAPDTGQPYILLATQTFGRGHTAILTTDGLWRWKMSEPSDARVVETFWQQLLLAIGRRAEREHIHFVNVPAQVKVGEVVSLRLAGVAADTAPVVVAKLPDGRGARVTPTPTGDAAAPWRINWKPSLPGSWEFVAAVEGDVLGGEVAGRAGQHPPAGSQQGRLVPFDGQHVVGAPVGDQVPGGLTLGMESIGRDDDARQIQTGQ